MNYDKYSSIISGVIRGIFAGILIGWAVKKVNKLFSIVAGLFSAGLFYLQYQQIASINRDKIEQASGGVVYFRKCNNKSD